MGDFRKRKAEFVYKKALFTTLNRNYLTWCYPVGEKLNWFCHPSVTLFSRSLLARFSCKICSYTRAMSSLQGVLARIVATALVSSTLVVVPIFSSIPAVASTPLSIGSREFHRRARDKSRPGRLRHYWLQRGRFFTCQHWFSQTLPRTPPSRLLRRLGSHQQRDTLQQHGRTWNEFLLSRIKRTPMTRLPV